MTISLVVLGQTELGKSGNVSLIDINESGAETRSYSGTGYKRVNRFEIEDGNAEAPSDGDVSLENWDGYTQWDNSRAQGDTFDCTGKDHESLDFSWVRPSGYTAFPQAEVQQQLWCKKCATQTQAGCELEDALDGSAYATTDGTTAGTGNVLDSLSWYQCKVVMGWDDEGVAGFPRQSLGYDAVASPGQGGSDNVDSIVIKTDDDPPPPCDANGEACTGCPTQSACCSGWCDGFTCQASEPFC